MQVIGYGAVILATFLVTMIAIDGLANVVDDLAYRMHCFAVKLRTAREKRAKGLDSAWVRQLETNSNG